MSFENNRLIADHLLRTLGDNTLDLIYAKDTDGRYIYANATLLKMLGLERFDELAGRTDFDIHPQAIAQGYFDDDQRVLQSGAGLTDREELVPDAVSGESRWHSTTKVPLFDQDRTIIGVMGITRDITPRKQAELETQRLNIELEQRVQERTAELQALTHTIEKERSLMRTLIDSIPDNIYAKDNESRFLLINRSGAGFMGTVPEAVLGKSDFDFFSEEMARQYYNDEQIIIHTNTPLMEREEPSLNAGTGDKRWMLTSKVPFYDEYGKVAGVVGIGRDITDRKSAEQRIQYLATHDHLTGLPNRTMFSEILEHAIESAHRYDRKLALLFIDLDRFKEINDTLGHEAGDQLLKEMAKRFTASLRSSDVIARFGGDEFVILLQAAESLASTGQVAEKLIAAAIEPASIMGERRQVSASIGISLFPSDGADEQTLTKNADIAMYRAKARGKNTHCFFADRNTSDRQ